MVLRLIILLYSVKKMRITVFTRRWTFIHNPTHTHMTHSDTSQPLCLPATCHIRHKSSLRWTTFGRRNDRLVPTSCAICHVVTPVSANNKNSIAQRPFTNKWTTAAKLKQEHNGYIWLYEFIHAKGRGFGSRPVAVQANFTQEFLFWTVGKTWLQVWSLGKLF